MPSTVEKISIQVAENEQRTLNILQNEHPIDGFSHVADFDIELLQGATLKMNVITLHGGNVTNNIKVTLSGKGASCSLNGLYLCSQSQRVSTRVNVIHKVPECVSNQLFRGILDDSSSAEFEGEILVENGAQKTEAYQANNNLLLADTARASSEPHLIIYADDVKCSHGSTIGSLREDELFYLRSRGISEREAKLLQMQAFAGAVVNKIEDMKMRDKCNLLIHKCLRGGVKLSTKVKI